MRLGSVENEDDGGIVDGVKGIQQLQMLTDKLHRLIHLLSLTIDVTFNIQDLASRLKAGAEDSWESTDQTVSDLNMCFVQLRIHKSRLESLTTRSIGISTPARSSICQ